MVIQQNGNDVNNYYFALGNGSSSSHILYRLTANVWQKVKFERRGTVLNLYINDTLAATQPCFTEDIYFLPNSNVTLGYNANYGRYFNGGIRNLRYFFILSSYRELTIADPGAVWLGNAPQTPVSTGNSFNTDVNITCGELKVYAIQTIIQFDSNVLAIDPSIWPLKDGFYQFEDWDANGDHIGYTVINPNNPGKLIFSGYNIYGKGPGVVSWLPIKWVAKAPGTSEISITVEVLATCDEFNYYSISELGTKVGYSSTITVQ